MRKLRWGILGAAAIARRAVAPAIRSSETGELAAVASRSTERAKAFAREFDIPAVYADYGELLRDPGIDAVYIPLPNHLHARWTIEAAREGKHVLCEKPLALDAGQAQEMVCACERAGVKLAEAFMYRYHPRFDRMKQLIAAGEIGEIRGIHGTFSFNNASAADNVRFYREMGGGGLYDVGCYPIDAARLLLEAEPEAVTAHGFFSERHDGVDMYLAGLLEFPGGISATFDCGMWASGGQRLVVTGSDGRIEVPYPFLYKSNQDAAFTVHKGGETRLETAEELDQYVLQVDSFGLSALYDTPLRFSPDSSVRNMRVVEAAFRSACERTRVVISSSQEA